MRSIGVACALAGLAAGVLAPAGARAAEPDWKAATAAYAKARDTALKAKAQPDYALCAGDWAAWDDALYDGRVSDGTMALLDADLRTDSADEKVNLWRLWLGDDAKRFDLFDMHRQAAKAQIDQALGGDKLALAAMMGALGGCQLPKDK
jgi:hypothetical protein